MPTWKSKGKGRGLEVRVCTLDNFSSTTILILFTADFLFQVLVGGWGERGADFLANRKLPRDAPDATWVDHVGGEAAEESEGKVGN